MATTTIYYSNKTRIQDQTELSRLSLSEFNYLIDTSEISNVEISTRKTPISDFAHQNDILNKAAAKRYWTKTNNLQHTDLRLFSAYAQDNTNHEKKVYFEEFPIVDSPLPKNSEISTTQLLTKENVKDFQSYLSKKRLNTFACIPAYNWENEYNEDATTGEKTPFYEPVSSFIELLKKTKHDSRATYKFEYTRLSPEKNNVERTTNIVPLNQFKYNDTDVTAVVHYSVAGLVSVKSDLEDQRSGTIYLEARRAGAKDDSVDGEWRTIDSAVFKFTPNSNEKSTPGTYVTLSGYLSTEFETRLKLNLKSQGYSMNLYELRDENLALTNHYVNTFLGFVHIPDANANQTNGIYFTNINYQSYFYRGVGFQSFSYQYGRNETIRTFSSVKELLNAFDPTHELSASMLKISSSNMRNPIHFEINGVRLSPIGEIYKLTDPITVEAGATVYPSYTSGTIEAIRPTTTTSASMNAGSARYTLADSDIVNRINYSNLRVLPNLAWNKQTEIYGKISAELSAVNDTRGTIIIPGHTEYEEVERTTTLNYGGTLSAKDYGREDPKRQFKGDTTTFNFSGDLAGKRIVPGSLITCSMHIWPETWGKGDGSESFGRIYTGNDHIVNEGTLKTDNYSHAFTIGLCTGSEWNYSARASNITFTQPNSYRTFKLAAYADTAHKDGRRETWFGVYANSIKVMYREISSRRYVTDPESQPTGEYQRYRAKFNANADCVIASGNYAYPSSVSGSTLSYDTYSSPIKRLTNSTSFQRITAYNVNYKETATSATAYTTLTVLPYPQNLIL